MRADPLRLPPVPAGTLDAVAWVDEHLGHLTAEGPGGTFASGRFAGGQAAADAALAAFDVSGYARARNEVWPADRRGASALSPYIRHGLLTLPRVWAHVESGPAWDVRKFRDELLWQEYARHLYARMGTRLGQSLRAQPAVTSAEWTEPWPRDMACLDLVLGELERDGWMVNQTRMWLASQWTVRAGRAWQDGEDRFFTHLLDGSRAANRVGWQWVVGAAGKAYGFSRWQVEKRAPGLCAACVHARSCPIQGWPDVVPATAVEPPLELRGDEDPDRTGGPAWVVDGGRPPEAVWLTAESLGDEDPALVAHPALPAVFVFDARRLARWRLSGKRLVFLAQALAGVAGSGREVHLWLGAPADVLEGRAVATTFTPVPGWRRLAAGLDAPTVHPWPWLARPHGGRAQSFSAWVKQARPLVRT